MRIRVKSPGLWGNIRIDSHAKIDNAITENGVVTILFKGEETSGILNLTTKDLDFLQNSVKKSKPSTTIPLIEEIKPKQIAKPKTNPKAKKLKPKTQSKTKKAKKKTTKRVKTKASKKRARKRK